MTQTLTRGHIDTPTGEMFAIVGDDGRLCVLEWSDKEARGMELLRRGHGAVSLKSGAVPADIVAALKAYFDGNFGAAAKLPVNPAGTPFQLEAWSALRRIPPGETRSYSEQASSIGRPAATRAIGLANGANPIAIVVPCHRVIGADGSLTGFGGGLERKRWLLAHEGAHVATAQPELLF